MNGERARDISAEPMILRDGARGLREMGSRALPSWATGGAAALVRSAWLVLPVVAAIVAITTAATSSGIGRFPDTQLFATAGCQILAGHVAAVYSNPALQSGPLQNTLYCGMLRMSSFADSSVRFGLAAAIGIGGVLAGLKAVRAWTGLASCGAIVAIAGAYIALWALPTLLSIHSAEVFIPLMWVTAATLIHRHPVVAGLVLGATVGFELWGMVAIPIVLAAATWGRRALAAAVAAGAAALLVLPFALAGHLAMFHFVWPIMPHTLPALLWPAAGTELPLHFGLAARVIQLILACGGCGIVAYRVRDERRLLPWAPAMAAEFLRLLIDPTLYSYYWAVPELLATVALVCAATIRQRLMLGAVAVLQVAGELNEYRVVVVAVSLLLISSAILDVSPRRRARLEGTVAAATT